MHLNDVPAHGLAKPSDSPWPLAVSDGRHLCIPRCTAHMTTVLMGVSGLFAPTGPMCETVCPRVRGRCLPPEWRDPRRLLLCTTLLNASAVRTMQALEALIDLKAYHAIVLLGSGGCGKTVLMSQLHRRLSTQRGSGVVRCANSGRVAVNAGCSTMARTLKYGSYQPHCLPQYSDNKVAHEVARISVMLVEEVTAIPNFLFAHHMGAYRDAKSVLNTAAASLQRPQLHGDVGGPLSGLQLVATGDHLQQLSASGGVGNVDRHAGSVTAFLPPSAASDDVWEFTSLQDADVLWLIGHGNFRFVGRMRTVHATGCAFAQICPADDAITACACVCDVPACIRHSAGAGTCCCLKHPPSSRSSGFAKGRLSNADAGAWSVAGRRGTSTPSACST